MPEEDAQQPRRSSAISSQNDEDSEEDQNNANEHPSVRHHLSSIILDHGRYYISCTGLSWYRIVLPGKYNLSCFVVFGTFTKFALCTHR